MSQNKFESLQDVFGDVLTEELQLEMAVDYALAQVAGRAIRAKEKSELSIREIARKMGLKNTAQVQRILNVDEPHNLTLGTLARFCYACGYELAVEFKVPKHSTKDWPVNEEWSASSFVPSKIPSLPPMNLWLTPATGRARLECGVADEFLRVPGKPARGLVNNQRPGEGDLLA